MRDRSGEVRGQLRERLANDQGNNGQEIRRVVAHRGRGGLRLRDNLSIEASSVHVLRRQFGNMHMEIRVTTDDVQIVSMHIFKQNCERVKLLVFFVFFLFCKCATRALKQL